MDHSKDLGVNTDTRVTEEAQYAPISGFHHAAEKHADDDDLSESSRDGNAVHVGRAEAQFQALNRQISHVSQTSRLSRTTSRRSTRKGMADVEKDADLDSQEEPFDLESTLRNSKAMEDETGIKGKRLGVLWEDLTVNGIGGSKTYVKTFPDAAVSFFNVWETATHIYRKLSGKKSNEVPILSNFRGLAKPGELVLVLGRPGAGCTSFLKTISNQRRGYSSITGDVSYGPFNSDFFGEQYRGEACYNDSDDTHNATLTVEQTLQFGLDCKIGGRIPGNMNPKQFKASIIDLLLKMFGISHTRNTFLGNQHIRGVSGGERKRVSIAEMLITGAPICCWDNSTRGLDSSSALDYVKSLRIISNIYRTTTFVSLYQASESIYKQFDRVLLIDSGKTMYYGPAGNAPREYFEQLGYIEKPRQTSADYLTGCMDPFERGFRSGRDESNVPSTPSALEKVFNESTYAKDLTHEIQEYKQSLAGEKHVHDEFQAAVLEGKKAKRSVYTNPFYLQVYFLAKRQFFLKLQDRFNLCVSWTLAITIAIVLGTVWLNLPKTSAGAFTRGGLLFIALLFNAFNAFSELAFTLLGRSLQNKHRAYAFHTPSAQFIAQLFVDLAFAAAQILVFGLIVYFMTGLVRDAGAFFTFYLVILTTYLSMTLVFRTIGILSPDFDYAIRFATILLPLLVMTNGYLTQSPPDYYRWIFWVNNLGLGFSALVINEFERIDLTCTTLIPPYGDISHQSCTLKGSQPGNPVISGTDYIVSSFNYSGGIRALWRNYGIILAIIIFFLTVVVLSSELLQYGAGGKTVTFYAKEDKELKKLNQELQEKRQRRLRKENVDVETESALNLKSEAILTWENLCYDVPIKGSQNKRLLKDVFGYVAPGQLTALMGASGAGKTTLLDVLASRKNVGVISGDVLVDGLRQGTAFQRGTGYAEQLDLHESTQTVREALRFSADLRQPYETPQAEKYAYVEEILSLLELEDIADAIIGSPDSGLGVEQRKRVTLGVELSAKPELLLFLDEPTSGLDSQSAFNIVRFLQKLKNSNQAILCTIHQPNSVLFDMFDRLLLLQKGGETVFFGETPKLLPYFSKYGADAPLDANPAEFMLECIGAGQRPRFGDRDWAEIWNESEEFAQVKEDITRMKDKRRQLVGDQPKVVEKEYATPLWHQIKVVCRRTNLAFWRSASYGFTRCFNHATLAMIGGLAFVQLGNSRSDMQYRVFVVFLVTVLPALILAQVEPKYDLSRLIFYRESSAKAYRQFPFALAMVLAEMPYSVICAVVFFLPLYFIPGFNPMPDRAGYQFLMILITEVFSVTLGQMIASITPSSFISSLVNPFVIINFGLFCGVTIPYSSMPHFWKSWLYQLDPFTRLIAGMVVTELHDLPVICTSAELNNFTAPSGQTCGTYMAPFFNDGGSGYLTSNDTQDCSYCAYKVGDQFYDTLGYSFDNRWRDLGIFLAFVGSNLVILFLGSRYLNFNRR